MADTMAWTTMEAMFVYRWVILLFLFSLAVGVVAPVSGVGGGVLFVPLATALFPFHVDFIRGCGLIVALTSSLFSGPFLLRRGIANLQIMFPLAAASLVGSTAGGLLGLRLTSVLDAGAFLIILILGMLLFLIFALMLVSRSTEFPEGRRVDGLSMRWGLQGSWFEPRRRSVVSYQAARIGIGMLCFVAVGFVAGMFGLGAGWASVPILNLIMGLPIKPAVATSMIIIMVNSSAAAWIYLARGALLPFLLVPSVLGVSIGAYIGGKLVERAKPLFIRVLVLTVMLYAAVVNIFKGLRGLEFL